MTARPLSHLVAEGRSLLAEATRGEWSATPPSGPWPADYWAVGTTADGMLERFTSAGPDGAFDAFAIAWAMTNLPHLLDALDRVQALLREWEHGTRPADADLFGAIEQHGINQLRTALEGSPTE